MSPLTIARKDFEDAVRAKVVWFVTLVFLALMTGASYGPAILVPERLTPDQALSFLTGPTSTVVPITALVAGYLAVAGERETGSIKILLGLPHTRRDVLVGKWLGRTAVVTIGILLGFVASWPVLYATYGSGPTAGRYLGFMLLTVLLGVVFCSLAVGISAAVRTRARAMAGVVGTFFLFEFLWQAIPAGVFYAVTGDLPGPTEHAPTWYVLLERLNPLNAYSFVGESVIPPVGTGIVLSGSGATSTGSPEGQAAATAEAATGTLGEPFAIAVLLAWVLTPVLLGYLRFRQVDLP